MSGWEQLFLKSNGRGYHGVPMKPSFVPLLNRADLVLLYLMIGVTVSSTVLSVGPLITFGCLLIPALTAHLFARTMKQFFIFASVFGGVSSFPGFWLVYQRDWPIGPSDLVLLGVVYVSAWGLQRLARLLRGAN